MSSHNHYRLPEVTVVHLDLGEHRSISIEDFLRNIKRDPGSFSSKRNLIKRPQPEPTVKTQHQKHDGETSMLALDVETPLAFDVQQVRAKTPIKPDRSSRDDDTQLASEERFPKSPIGYPRLRRVYKGKHTNLVTIPNLTPLATEEYPQVQDDLNWNHWRSLSCSKLPFKSTRQPQPNTKIKRILSATSETKAGRKQRRRHAPVNELPLIDGFNCGTSQDNRDDSEASISRETLHDTIETCTQAGLDPGRTVKKHAIRKRQVAPKYLSNIRKSLRQPKSNRIDPNHFKLPPQTPTTTIPRSWKPGSGFRDRANPQKSRQRTAILPSHDAPVNPTTIKRDLRRGEKRRTPIKGNATYDSASLNNLQIGSSSDSIQLSTSPKPADPIAMSDGFRKSFIETPEVDEVLGVSSEDHPPIVTSASTSDQGAEKGQHENIVRGLSPFLGKKPRVVRQLQGRRGAPNTCPENEAAVTAMGSNIVPTFDPPALLSMPLREQNKNESVSTMTLNLPSNSFAEEIPRLNAPPYLANSGNRQQRYASTLLPIKRGTSFMLVPRIEFKGDLHLGRSPLSKRMTSLPFVPPFKKNI